MSIRKYFEEELNALKLALVKMCRTTEEMIDGAIHALIMQDTVLAKNVIEMDPDVDAMELDIEKKCLRFMLRQAPVAKDFREVSTTLKLITDIERIGDQASDISELVVHLAERKCRYVKDLQHIERMGKLAVKMVHNSVDSFIRNDNDLAMETARLDDEMDELFNVVMEELIELIKKDSQNADQAIIFMMITKYLERIGDHAVNVCEWTEYNETGVHQKY